MANKSMECSKIFKDAKLTHVRHKIDLRNNVTIVSDGEVFVCTVCDRSCLSFARLKSHLRTLGKRTSTD